MRAAIGWEGLPSIWSQGVGLQGRCSRLTAPRPLLDDCDLWTLNASSTRLSNSRKCTRRLISGHSAQATFLRPIEGTTKCSPIVRGLSFGSGTASAAELKLRNSGCLKMGADSLRRGGRLLRWFLLVPHVRQAALQFFRQVCVSGNRMYGLPGFLSQPRIQFVRSRFNVSALLSHGHPF
jgi:hypothetical protein